MGSDLFRCKSIDQLLSDSENAEVGLKKSLGWVSLTALGIGAVIGSGIFTVIGTAIAGQKLQASSILNAPLLEYLIYHSASFGRPGAGPAIALSFVLVAIVCGFASVCYAELAAMIPIAGSAYTYTYATMGELIAWIIGWDLFWNTPSATWRCAWVLGAHCGPDGFFWHSSEPAMDFSGLSADAAVRLSGQQAYCDPAGTLDSIVPAFLIVMLLTVVLIRGIRESAGANNIMVLLKIVGDPGIYRLRRTPGASRQLASVRAQWLAGDSDRRLDRFLHLHRIDSVSTAAEECKRPAARFADRNYCDADCLHGAVYRRGGGADRTGAVANAGGRRRTGSKYAKKLHVTRRAAGGAHRRVDGNDFFRCWFFNWDKPACGLRCRATDCCREFSAGCTRDFKRRIFPP